MFFFDPPSRMHDPIESRLTSLRRSVAVKLGKHETRRVSECVSFCKAIPRGRLASFTNEQLIKERLPYSLSRCALLRKRAAPDGDGSTHVSTKVIDVERDKGDGVIGKISADFCAKFDLPGMKTQAVQFRRRIKSDGDSVRGMM